MALDVIEHEIEANNILFGLTRFLTLTLPVEWKITRSYLQPDVHTNVRRGAGLWVEAGQTDQIVYHPLRRVALDMTIMVKRGMPKEMKTKGIDIHSQGTLTINTHEASYYLGEVGIGFLKRKRARTLGLCISCSDLGRTIMIRFTGNCQETDLKGILSAIPYSKCH